MTDPSMAMRKRSSVTSGNSSGAPSSFAIPTFIPVKEAHWVPDQSRSACVSCIKEFNVFTRRKHHCRGCAEIFCEDCASFKLIAKDSLKRHEIVAVRVCGNCFEKYAVREGETLHGPTTIQTPPTKRPTTNHPTTHQVKLEPDQWQRSGSASAPPPSIAHQSDSTTTPFPPPSPVPFTISPTLLAHPYVIPGATFSLMLFILITTWFSWLGILFASALLVVLAVFQQQHKITDSSTSTASRSDSAVTSTSSTSHPDTSHPPPRAIDTHFTARPRSSTHSDTLEAPHSASEATTHRHSFPSSSTSSHSGQDPNSDLDHLHLSAQDREIVRRSRVGLSVVQSYHTNASGWLTKKITKFDGSGSISLTPQLETQQYDCQSPPPYLDDTIVIQTKLVPDPFNPSLQRRTWKGIGVMRVPPEHLLRLYLDQDHQVEWNKALIHAETIRIIPHTRTTVTYCVSASAVGGAVSPREFIDTHDWSRVQRTDVHGRVHQDFIFAGVGIEPPLFNHPHNKKYTLGFNGPAGFMMCELQPPHQPTNSSSTTPSSTTAGSSDHWTSFVVIIDTDVRGWIPRALIDSSMPDVIIDYFTNLRASWKLRIDQNLPLPPMPKETE